MHLFQRLFYYIKKYKRYVVLNIACNVLMVFFNIVSIPMLIPFLQILLGQTIPPTQKPDFQWTIKSLTDSFYYQLGHIIEVNGKERALIYVCIGLALVFFFKNMFRYFALYCITPLRNGVVRDIRQDLYNKVLRLPLSYFSEERKGDLISRISNDVGEIEWSILNVLETLVREPLLILGALGIMLYLSPSLTLFVLILLILTGIIIGGIGKTLKKESALTQQKLGDMLSVLDETLGAIRVIKGFNAEKFRREKFAVESNAYRNAMTQALRRRDLASPLTEFLGIGVVCVLIWFGFKQVEADPIKFSASAFIAFLYAFFTVIEPAKAYSNASYQIQRGKAAIDRIDEILNAEETIQDPINPTLLPIFKDKIEYRNVSFYYANSDTPVLKNINLTIPKGKIVALVGASGAGKSTLADLLPRFYDATEGGVYIDGVNVKDMKINDLRKHMGIVTQEALLFNDTIYNNIVFGLENVQEHDVINAAKAANAHEFIENMEGRHPDKVGTEGGYQTNIGDRGTKLSGGQRQRMTIARAILRNPDILILDEATSALDSESEKLVQAALIELMKNRTAIIIAHRLSTIQHADVICVLNNGVIIEQGTHEQLYQKGGEYRKLVELQGLN